MICMQLCAKANIISSIMYFCLQMCTRVPLKVPLAKLTAIYRLKKWVTSANNVSFNFIARRKRDRIADEMRR